MRVSRPAVLFHVKHSPPARARVRKNALRDCVSADRRAFVEWSLGESNP